MQEEAREAQGFEPRPAGAQAQDLASAAVAFEEFARTIAALRALDGCPWDREQTHASIGSNMTEEAYEALAAIEDNDIPHMREELGDVLLQVVLQAQIAAEAGEFTLEDVIRDVNAKMVRRHPHVFGTQAAFAAAGIDPAGVETANEVLDLWEQIKVHEKRMKEADRLARRTAAGFPPDMPAGILDDVPRSQPALAQAQQISKKAVKAGFEWETEDDVWRKVFEEISEFRACEPGSHEAQLEMGDVLFTLTNVARKQHFDAESALRDTCGKFRSRWASMEMEAYNRGVDLATLSLDQLESLWQDAKKKEN